MEEPEKKWVAEYENESGSPNQPKSEKVILEGYPDHKTALEAAMNLAPPFVDGVLRRVERIL